MTNDLLTIGLAVTQIAGTVIAVWYTVSSSLKKGLENQMATLKEDLKEDLATLKEVQKNQAEQLRELEKRLSKHELYVERTFAPKKEVDDLKTRYMETQALIVRALGLREVSNGKAG